MIELPSLILVTINIQSLGDCLMPFQSVDLSFDLPELLALEPLCVLQEQAIFVRAVVIAFHASAETIKVLLMHAYSNIVTDAFDLLATSVGLLV